MRKDFEQYQDTTSAILDGYLNRIIELLEDDILVTDDVVAAVRKHWSGMETELAEADKNLTKDLEDFIEESGMDESPANRVLLILNDHTWDKDEQVEILEALNPSDDAVLEHLDGTDATRYTVIGLNMMQREKLDQFVKTEIFTSYNDQQINIL